MELTIPEKMGAKVTSLMGREDGCGQQYLIKLRGV